MAHRIGDIAYAAAAPAALFIGVAVVVWALGQPRAPAEQAPEAATAAARVYDETRARLLCEGLDRSGILSAPCEVGWGSTITITVDTTAAEAREACAAVARQSERFGFERPWRLQIRSPWSTSPIAFCTI